MSHLDDLGAFLDGIEGAGFTAGAASRDAEVVGLGSQIATAAELHEADLIRIQTAEVKVTDLQAKLDALTPKPWPMVVSPQANAGESWAQASLRNLAYGFNGLVRYYTASQAMSWDAQFKALAVIHANTALTVQITAKTHSDAGLAEILANAPKAWTVLYNFFQEPEDNLTTETQQVDYRATYTAAAKVTRAAGAPLPWLELQEWTLNPANKQPWAGKIAPFIPAAEDFGGILWSLFDLNERDLIDAQVARIVAAMAQYAPGKPWALMASGMPLHPTAGPWTAAQQKAQADWITHSYKAVKAAGGAGWGYFNFNSSGQNHIDANPQALAAVKSLV